MTEIYVAVGANVEPEANILRALDRLQGAVRVVATSTFCRTEPERRPRQPAFLNGVWRLDTDLEPRPLKFDLLRPIEAELGRVRSADKDAPRPIDLDLVLYGGRVVCEPDLRLPDPEIRRRPFVAVPLLELAPELVLPDSTERLADLPVAGEGKLRPAETLTSTLKERIRDGQQACRGTRS
jgi:2-amino-4-hydroxy-6-hydroxymethyldihydropteridine diphosphokinase